MPLNKCSECSCEGSLNDNDYCRECGHHEPEPIFIEPALLRPNGRWPTGTWFQQRRALILKRTSDELSKVL